MSNLRVFVSEDGKQAILPFAGVSVDDINRTGKRIDVLNCICQVVNSFIILSSFTSWESTVLKASWQAHQLDHIQSSNVAVRESAMAALRCYWDTALSPSAYTHEFKCCLFVNIIKHLMVWPRLFIPIVLQFVLPQISIIQVYDYLS